ncbi:hypothetical protein HWI79_1038 [Cryptosporidium felis]|nr:hypothetical protein HWI79_1038 [Cryptosporidium felis]
MTQVCVGKKMSHFELNTLDTITRSLKNTVFVDIMGKTSFSLTNSGFSPGPKIYLKRDVLRNHKEVKAIFKMIRKKLMKFYIEEFGIILAYHMSQIEQIDQVGIDTHGNIRLVVFSPNRSKKKMLPLKKGLTKKGKFPSSNTLEEVGRVNRDLRATQELSSSYSEHTGFEPFNKFGVSLLNLKSAFNRIGELHVVSSKANNQIAICKCKISHSVHSKLVMVSQTLLFAIHHSIDHLNSPWYSMPDFISVLLEDLMRISSIMRFLGPMHSKFKNIKEYYKYAKKQTKNGQRNYFKKFFTNKRNNYQTKFLLQILGIIISFFGNIFNSFFEDFRRNPALIDFAAQIEISSGAEFKVPNSKKKLFSKQDLIFISEYIEGLSDNKNCITYPKVKGDSFGSPDERAIFTLC